MNLPDEMIQPPIHADRFGEWISERGTKHDFAASAILRDILQRNLTSESRLEPERELAKKLGISYMTVRAGVTRLVEEEIVERRHGKGVFLIKPVRPTTVLALYLDVYDWKKTYLVNLFPALEKVIAGKGLTMEIVATSNGSDAARDYSRLVRRWQRGEIKGILLASRYPARQVLHLIASGIPFVWINDALGKEPVYAIQTDYPGAFFGSIPVFHSHRSKMLHVVSYPALMRNWMLLFEHVSRCGAWQREKLAYTEIGSVEHPQKEVAGFFDRITLPCAIYVTGETLYRQIIEEALARGIAIPGQLAIVVEHVTSSPDSFRMAPSGWELPFDDMATQSVSLLERSTRQIPHQPIIEYVHTRFRQGATTFSPPYAP